MSQGAYVGPDGQLMTYEQIQRQHKLAAYLASQGNSPKSLGEGISNFAGQLSGAFVDWNANKDEAAQKQKVTDAYNALGDNPSREAIMALVGNDFAGPGQSAVAQALLAQSMKATDPEYQLDQKYKQAQIDALEAKPEQKMSRVLSAEEATGMGLPAGVTYQVDGNGKVDPIGTGSGITINTGDNSGAFSKKGDELAAARMDAFVSGGNDAENFMGDLNALKDIATNLNTGKGAQIVEQLGPYAEMVGIDVKGLDEAQAFKAIVDKLAPQMRVPGSGASSDFDARQFLSSLPGLGKTPEGNKLIMDTFQGIQERKIKAAEIASQAFMSKDQGGITWQEADKQIRALGDPYTAFKEAQKAAATGEAHAPADYPGVTIRQID